MISFDPAPEGFDLHPNRAHATQAQADQIQAATAAATTITFTLTDFSSTRTDYVMDMYFMREMRRN